MRFDGAIAADDGDLLLTRSEWARGFGMDPVEHLAGGAAGSLRLGFCPDFRIRGPFGP